MLGAARVRREQHGPGPFIIGNNSLCTFLGQNPMVDQHKSWLMIDPAAISGRVGEL